MALTESPNQQAWREFEELKCSVCGNQKAKGMSFCRKCYFSLPPEMRQALYERFGSGYEEAYHEAKDWLNGERRAG